MIPMKLAKVSRKNWFFSIYVKLVLAFLIVIVPLYALTLKINENGKASVRSEISKSAMSNVHFYLYTLQSEMERIIKMQREYMNDEDLQLLSVASWDMTPYERTSRALKLQKKAGFNEEFEYIHPKCKRSYSDDGTNDFHLTISQ